MTTQDGTHARLARGLAALPGLQRLREAAGDVPVYLVGGSVRDILLDRRRGDLDVVVEGNAVGLARRLGGEELSDARFATGVANLDGQRVDFASSRSETYSTPGALPDVRPAPLTEDLARRDFTVNAMAVPLQGEPQLIDPHGGEGDLAAGVLRVLHDRSFVDDPTRALRAARYATRLGFAPEPETERLLRAADLGTVSRDRVEAELRQLAAEEDPRPGFEAGAEWGLIELGPGAGELIDGLNALLESAPWSSVTNREDAVLAALEGRRDTLAELAAAEPERPSEGVALAEDRSGMELALARAAGAEWLDRYVGEWRQVRLEITGEDLLAAGVAEGPALGRGLAAALAAKLDGKVSGREQELETALAAARG